MKFEQTPTLEPHAEEYKKVKDRLFEIFSNKNEHEISEVYSEIRRNAEVVHFDAEDVLKYLQENLNRESVEVLVANTFEALKYIVDQKIEHPELFEKARREGILQHGGNVKISELMYYNMNFENNTALLHVAPRADMKFGEVLKAFREGIQELAEQVRDDERIQEIQATSWIVASNPKLLEKVGFTVEGLIGEMEKEEHFKNEKRPVAWAHISRDELLKRYPAA